MDGVLQMLIFQVYPDALFIMLTRAINTIFTSRSVVNEWSLPVCTFVPLLARTNFGETVFTPTVLSSNVSERC